ncbi:MAG TPA: glutamate 2,3-aminomutase [Desulfobacteria bacterium]|nr:glutamate 2,3-aminomutase [Desulfobacteria bacterium]
MSSNEEVLLITDERNKSLQRAGELRYRISDYMAARGHITTGFDYHEAAEDTKLRILAHFGAKEKDWYDWRWQMRHRITTPELLSEFIELEEDRIHEIEKVQGCYRWAVSPYYASLMESGSLHCPILLQAVPGNSELDNNGECDDPMSEEFTSPAPCITRRYPDRVVINVTNRCAVYCRHCQRRRNLGWKDRNKPIQDLVEALNYIKTNREIRDVIITGGDALLLSDNMLDWLLTELDRIEHVEIKRIGTRVPVTLPQRITANLCCILKKHPPIYLNTQFNHPKEITKDSARACDMLVGAGVIMGNQTVLLRGINNNAHVMKRLNQELLKIRVRPYYLFQAIGVTGTHHFITEVTEGIKIIEKLRGFTSGLAVPTYVINVPGGLGKVPVQPAYVISAKDGEVVLRTWEGKVLTYTPANGSSSL